jgi:long-subunit fatty acid transport protein
LNYRVSLGIGLHVPPLLLSRARAPFPGDPFLALLENRGQVVAFMVGGGVRVARTVTVGIAAVALAALSGGIDVAADTTKRFASTSEQQLLIDYAAVIGARWQIKPKLSVGLVYRGVSKAPFDILVTNMIGDALPVTLPAIRVRGYSQYDPAMVEAEGSYEVARKVTVIAALAWKRWSAFPPPTEDPVIDAPPRVRPGFSDTFVPKLAVRYFAKKNLEFRAGYRLEMTPAPEQTGRENLLDNTRHFLVGRVSVKDQTLPPEERDPVYLAIGSGGRILVGGFTLGVDL